MKSLRIALAISTLALSSLTLGLSSCASAKTETKQETSASNPSTNPQQTPAPTSAPTAQEERVDQPDSTGIIRGRYYGEGLDVILGRTVRWCIENGWQILNDGAGAGGTVVAKGSIRGFQKVTGTPELGQKAGYLCAECGTDDKGQIIAEEGKMVVRVRTLALGKTKFTVDFSPIAPPYKPNAQCKSNGKFEQLLMNYLLHD